jgi:tRNA 2-thiouridine synthesizing protein A
MSEEEAMKTLDVRGEICPYPMMKTVEMVEKLSEAETLEVLTDHAPALSTIPIAVGPLGYLIRIEPLGPAEWRIIVYREGQEGNTQ